jgi:chitinase
LAPPIIAATGGQRTALAQNCPRAAMTRCTTLILALLALAARFATAAAAAPYISAYYNNWQRDLLAPAQVPFDLLSGVQYFVAVPQADGTLGDFDAALANEVVAAAKASGGKRVELVVGGWTGSRHISTILATAQGRTTLATSMTAAMQAGGFTGLEMDWEVRELMRPWPAC